MSNEPDDSILIPLPMVKLIIGDLQHCLTKPEREFLSTWIAQDTAREYAFEQCFDAWSGPFIDTSELDHRDEEEIHQLWDIAGLMVRYNKLDILQDEKQRLSDWRSKSVFNQNLFLAMRQSLNLKKVMLWLLEQVNYWERSELM